MRRFATQAARSKLPEINSISGYQLDDNDLLTKFREHAFIPQLPLHIIPLDKKESSSKGTIESIPALKRWFSTTRSKTKGNHVQEVALNPNYFAEFQGLYLPYELTIRHSSQDESTNDVAEKMITQFIPNFKLVDPEHKWHRFNAPLSLFLQAPLLGRAGIQLYIAQAQIADLPKALQDDVPTPRLVREAGKGDIYDANIWIGMQPTYTPLHKDPNPNLLVQLASRKQVRLFPPIIGRGIFDTVQATLGRKGLANMRGEEMMEGPEREALHAAVWEPQEGELTLSEQNEGVCEATLNKGDALFIPKGWWHSIKSDGPLDNENGSVNWWFR